MKNFNENEELRKNTPLPIREVIDKMMEIYQIKQRLDETKIIESWEKVMGKTISSRTKDLFVKDKKLHIKLSSSPLRKELSMNRSKIVGLLNSAAGKQVIQDIVLL